MNAKKTLKKLRGESDRLSTTVYVSQTILQEFKDSCGEVSPSRVLEELMREFVDDLSSRQKNTIVKKVSTQK